jgi:hypothetical protein
MAIAKISSKSLMYKAAPAWLLKQSGEILLASDKTALQGSNVRD